MSTVEANPVTSRAGRIMAHIRVGMEFFTVVVEMRFVRRDGSEQDVRPGRNLSKDGRGEKGEGHLLDASRGWHTPHTLPTLPAHETMQMNMDDVLVIGAGLIGSAASRHLAESGASVTLLGAAQGNARGVHASHYDEARITRLAGPDPVWAKLAEEAISRYRDIEERSGIPFHTPCGHVRIDLAESHPSSTLAKVREVVAASSHPIESWTPARLQDRFPWLSASVDSHVHWDPAPSGIIRPRRLIDAQHALIRNAGGTVIPGVVERVERGNDGFAAIDSTGRRWLAKQVVVATGAYTSRFALTPEPLELDVRPETVLLVESGDALRGHLRGMPGMIWNFAPDPRHGERGIDSVYILPPVRYPDGKWYLKIGADHDREVDVGSIETMHTYMESPGSESNAADLGRVIEDLIPILKGAPTRTKPCLLTYSPHGYPMVDEVAPGWFVAVAGCGKSAKSSDQTGKLAADLVLGRPWEGFDRESFRARARRVQE